MPQEAAIYSQHFIVCVGVASRCGRVCLCSPSSRPLSTPQSCPHATVVVHRVMNPRVSLQEVSCSFVPIRNHSRAVLACLLSHPSPWRLMTTQAWTPSLLPRIHALTVQSDFTSRKRHGGENGSGVLASEARMVCLSRSLCLGRVLFPFYRHVRGKEWRWIRMCLSIDSQASRTRLHSSFIICIVARRHEALVDGNHIVYFASLQLHSMNPARISTHSHS